VALSKVASILIWPDRVTTRLDNSDLKRCQMNEVVA
jgi:hypothetical protein